MNEYESYNGHGFKFEDAAVYKYKLIPEPKHTHKWDAYVNDRQRTPVSVKTVGRTNEIVFGDIFRQARIVESGFFAIVGVWEGSFDNLTSIYKLRINSSDWKKMFNQEIVNELEVFLNFAKNNHVSKELWKKKIKEFKAKWKSATENILRPRFRREKAKDGTYFNYRIQCAVSVKNFMNKIVGVETFGAELIAKGDEARDTLVNFSKMLDNNPNYKTKNADKKVNKKANKKVKVTKEIKQESSGDDLMDLLNRQRKELIIRAIYQLDRHLQGYSVSSLIEKSSEELSDLLKTLKSKRKMEVLQHA